MVGLGTPKARFTSSNSVAVGHAMMIPVFIRSVSVGLNT